LPANTKTLLISYRYNCDPNYQHCGDKEEYYLMQRYGLVQWIHYIFIKGSYAQLQKTIFNKLVVGVATPDFQSKVKCYRSGHRPDNSHRLNLDAAREIRGRKIG
jgi:hypothetical protein